jgi:hypothetical protein
MGEMPVTPQAAREPGSETLNMNEFPSSLANRCRAGIPAAENREIKTIILVPFGHPSRACRYRLDWRPRLKHQCINTEACEMSCRGRSDKIKPPQKKSKQASTIGSRVDKVRTEQETPIIPASPPEEWRYKAGDILNNGMSGLDTKNRTALPSSSFSISTRDGIRFGGTENFNFSSLSLFFHCAFHGIGQGWTKIGRYITYPKGVKSKGVTGEAEEQR